VTILSIVAVGRLAEHHVRQSTSPCPIETIVRWLVDSIGVQDDRARAGVRLACVVGRLEGTTDSAGSPCLRIPSDDRRAAA
jgi:hypothetical protein